MELLLTIFVLLLMSGGSLAQNLAYSSIRLVGGSGEHEGRVEILKDGEWGTVCDENWGRQEAKAVCNAHGYRGSAGSSAIAKRSAYFGQGTGPILFDDVICSTNAYLKNCQHACNVRGICDHSKDAGVICPLSVRLVGGSDIHEGRLEVYYKRQYGTLCDSGWGTKEAAVVCKSLGFSPEGAQIKTGSHFGKGTGNIWMDKVNCTGTEAGLEECRHADLETVSCNHDQEIGIICKPTTIRLTDGSGTFDGRVEVFNNNQWGSVCYTNVHLYDARSVCREMGIYRSGVKYSAKSKPSTTGIPTMLGNLRCGYYQPFQLCPGFCWNERDCTQELFVDCGLDIRLVGGSGPHEGRLEVYYNRQWGTACDANIGPNEANVICRNLGFQGDGATARGNAYFGAGTGKVAVDSITCQGSETELAKCQFNGLGKASCGHHNDVSIICKPTKYRLVGGRTESEGRVEVLVNGIWGTVCDKNWGNNHAKILCGELGFPGTRAVSYGGAYFGEGSGKIWLDNVVCYGNEETISTCKHSDWGVTNCKHNGDVSVLCRPSVRLVRGQTANQGRLEYFRYTSNGVNAWGTVCDRGFGTEEAEVVCRELEYPTDGAVAKAGAFFGEGTGPIYLTDVVCNGAEPTLTTCQSKNYGYYCAHTEDVSVICPGDINLYVNPVVNVETKKNDNEFRKMFQFYCDFSKVDKSLFYKSVWYINEAVVHQSQIIKGDNTNLREELSVTEDTLNRKVGYDIMCKIEVRENPTTNATVSSSKSRFIGIKVKTPTLRLKDGEVGQIRIQATAEIGCYGEAGNCEYSVSALIPESNGTTGKINNRCGVQILENGWDEEYSIQVKADITQSYQDYSRQFEITLYTPSYLDHKTWSEYTLIDKVTVIVERDPKPIRSKVCKAYCDPRLHTFNGININLNYLGTYTLYYDRENDIEVQIQTAPCGNGAYCNCGMIARVGGTAYMINKCSSQNWIMEYVMCDDGVSVLKVEKYSDIQITFPTGTYVKAQLISGNPPRFINVYVYPSILDVELPRGLCGKITENEDHHLVMRNNDITSDAINYNTKSFQDAETFVSSWRVGKAINLFDGDVRNNLQTGGTRTTVTCNCTSENGQTSDTLKCDAESPVNILKENKKYTAASTRSCKMATQSFQRKRRSVTNYVHHEHSRIKRTAQWTNGWTEQTAKQHCLDKFTESAMIQICQKRVPSFNLTDALEACKEDIKLLGNTEFALAAVESLKDFCLHEVYSDPILQSPPPSNNESSVFDEVTKEDCSEECKDHGSCVDGTCVCTAGYAGIDCNINTNLPPKADELEFNGLCDLKTSNYSDIALFGEVFTDQVDMRCKVSQLQVSKNGDMTSVSNSRIFSADVESLSEVVCPLPSLTDSDESTPEQQQTFTAFNLSVSYNGVDYSNQLSMVVFNSDCMDCSNTNGVIACSINPDFCVTNNRCYKVNETYPLNDQYVCTANSEGARWQRMGSDPNSPCAAGNHIPLPNAELRSPQNNVSSSAVNDLYLIEGWYGQVGKIIPYGTSPEGNACGARFPIYLQSQPSETTSEEQNLKACLRRYSNPCIVQVDVKAMYCGDDLFVYYLPSSPVSSYGYCLVDSNPAL